MHGSMSAAGGNQASRQARAARRLPPTLPQPDAVEMRVRVREQGTAICGFSIIETIRWLLPGFVSLVDIDKHHGTATIRCLLVAG
jgi:hypothetical protein